VKVPLNSCEFRYRDMQFYGQRATVMGLGRHGGGAAATRYLAEGGSIVTVTDLADSEALLESVASLADVPIARLTLGEHREEDFTQADLVVVSPAVRPDNPYVQLATRSGARITSEIELFLDACPATVIGITGTVGKSTTAAMAAAAIESSGRRAWLGGNIGHSLLGDLPRIRSHDSIVLELSSFQLHWLNDAARWPRLAALTNFAANHLDWHPSVEHYRQSKQRLLGRAVRVIEPWRQNDFPPLHVPGRHNRANAALAAACAEATGADRNSIARAITEFSGLPHRLALVAEIDSRQFYNDSKATTPEAAIAALEAMDRPTWILLGGLDKGVDLAPLARTVGQQANGAAVFGTVAPQLDELLTAIAPQLRHHPCETLDDAFAWCFHQSCPGDAILLSPACASLDQFRDYAERGERFADLVRGLSVVSC
jgi:UDP-N-acetylmuramoylalanine--D-glutamate ligase